MYCLRANKNLTTNRLIGFIFWRIICLNNSTEIILVALLHRTIESNVTFLYEIENDEIKVLYWTLQTEDN